MKTLSNKNKTFNISGTFNFVVSLNKLTETSQPHYTMLVSLHSDVVKVDRSKLAPILHIYVVSECSLVHGNEHYSFLH